MGEVTSHRALFPLSLHLTMEEPDDDTKIIYYLANGPVELWIFSNVLLIMKLVGAYFLRQQQQFTSWEFLNANVSILTH